MSCAFCDIVDGSASAAVVLQDATSVAFLDRRPLFPGHVLLVPRSHIITLSELDVALLEPLFHNAKILAAAVELSVQAQGTFVAINNRVSQSVPHLHIHIVPRNRKDGLKGFFWPRNPYRDDAHMQEVRSAVERAVQEVSIHPC